MYLWISLILWAIFCERLCPKKVFRNSRTGEISYRTSAIQAVLTFAPLIFFIGLRDQGADTSAYIKGFNDYPTGWDGLMSVIHENAKGVGFKIFGVLIKTYISQDFHVYLFIIAFISGTAIGFALWKYSDYFLLSFILFILSGTYTWMVNGIRQFMAVSIAFAAIGVLLSGKKLIYLCLILLLCSIHVSAIVLIPAIFSVTGRPWNKRTVLLLIASLIAMLFASRFVDVIDAMVESTNYENITSTFINDDGVNPLRVLVSAVPVIIAYLERKNLDRLATQKINMFINMSIIGLGINLIGMATSGIIIGRLPIYFTIYDLILLPWLTRRIAGQNRGPVTVAMLLSYLAFFYLQGRMYYSSDILKIFIRA